MFENVYILIPVYNEGSKVEEVINTLKPHFKNIVVVNDGSEDNTLSVLESLDVKLINHSVNLGQGAAISSGFDFIKKIENAEAVITFDADGQHSPQDAISFANEIIRCKEEIIFGTRFLENKKNIPFTKRMALSIIIFLTNKISKVNLSDVHNGLKAIKVSCLNKLNIDIDGFAFESQIIHIVGSGDISYKEMSTNIIYTQYSKNKGQKLLNGLIILEDIFRSRKTK